MTANPQALTDRTPTYADAAIFRGKTMLLQLRRAVVDLTGSSVGRHAVGNHLENEQVIATSATRLWTENEPQERFLVAGKIHNLRLAIKRLDGVEVPAGAIFSFWKQVGRASRLKGFVAGRELREGCIIPNIGGGLCQLGNLLYWMALHSPLTVSERYRHGFDVFPDINRNIPFACGATLAYNYIDLQLRNDTPDTFQIKLWLDDEYLNGELLSSRPTDHKFEIYETDHLIKMQPWGGYTRHNRIWKRTTSLTDGMTSENLVTENHAIMMYNPLLTA